MDSKRISYIINNRITEYILSVVITNFFFLTTLFDKLRLPLKNHLRTTVNEERFDSFALANINKGYLKSVDMGKDILPEFTKRSLEDCKL